MSALPSDLTVVRESHGHLLRLIGRKGRFVYAHREGDIEDAVEGYNLLRHCGTLWFMLRAVAEAGPAPMPAGAQVLAAAAGYAGGKLAAPGWAPGLCLMSRNRVKLGGTGLMLLMLAEYRGAMGRLGLPEPALPRPIGETVDALAAYAVSQMRGDGDFHHKRAFDTGEISAFRSGYYTGEALLGLLVAGRGAEAALSLQTLVAQGYGLAEQSHWMAYAVCEGIERGHLPAADGVGWLAALVQAINGDRTYRARRQSTPIACRSEALTRILMLDRRLPGTLPPGLAATCRAIAGENLALQLDWYADGQFRKGDDDDKVQIDYIQHNATAFLNRWRCA